MNVVILMSCNGVMSSENIYDDESEEEAFRSRGWKLLVEIDLKWLFVGPGGGLFILDLN